MNLTCKSFESEKNRVCSLCTMPKSHLWVFFIDNRSLESESSTGPSRWRQVQRAAGHEWFSVIQHENQKPGRNASVFRYVIWIVIPDRPIVAWIFEEFWNFGNRELQTAIQESLFVARSAPGPFCTMDPRPKLFANPPCNSLTHSFRFVHVLTRFYLSGSAHSFHKSHHQTSLWQSLGSVNLWNLRTSISALSWLKVALRASNAACRALKSASCCVNVNFFRYYFSKKKQRLFFESGTPVMLSPR